MSPFCLAVLSALSVNGGVDTSLPLVPLLDMGLSATSSASERRIHWPEALQPLATLEGPAVLAANVVLQHVLAGFPKQNAGTCEYSARALDVVVGQEGGLYFVRIDRRPDRCGWAVGASLEFDGFELYAVSPDGRILERYPSMP